MKSIIGQPSQLPAAIDNRRTANDAVVLAKTLQQMATSATDFAIRQVQVSSLEVGEATGKEGARQGAIAPLRACLTERSMAAGLADAGGRALEQLNESYAASEQLMDDNRELTRENAALVKEVAELKRREGQQVMIGEIGGFRFLQVKRPAGAGSLH